ncbi:MAG TPA: quinone oxidoreductase [Pedobacter sp.]
MKALTFSVFGGPEVLIYKDVPDPVLKQNGILLKMEFIGLNFADTYRRRGNYHLVGQPPYIAGYEGAGTVVDANGHPEFEVGDRVAFADVPLANAELVAVPCTHAIKLPVGISFETAASVLLQGLTAQYLAADSHAVKEGETVLIHAAAGGVGQLLIQICKMKGAKVIGLTTAEEKRSVILEAGADAAFNLGSDWKKEVLQFTGGNGADVVYDSVGSTLTDSLEIARIGGHVVFYGMSGGDPAPVDPRVLMDTSKTLSGGDLWSYLTSEKERAVRAKQLFDWIITGEIKLKAPVIFSLAEGRHAHEYLESGKSAGKVLMIP